MALSDLKDAVTRFGENEGRVDTFVNDPEEVGYYETRGIVEDPKCAPCDPPVVKRVESLPHLICRIDKTSDDLFQAITDEADALIRHITEEADGAVALATQEADRACECGNMACKCADEAARSAIEAMDLRDQLLQVLSEIPGFEANAYSFFGLKSDGFGLYVVEKGPDGAEIDTTEYSAWGVFPAGTEFTMQNGDLFMRLFFTA